MIPDSKAYPKNVGLIPAKDRYDQGKSLSLYLLLVVLNPFFYRLAVMHSQVVENQEHFAIGIPDEQLHELDKAVRVKCPVYDHPSALALVGNR